MSDVLSGGNLLDDRQPGSELTVFDRKVAEALNNPAVHMILLDDFKAYFAQYQMLMQQPLSAGLLFGSTGATYTPELSASTSAPTLGTGSFASGRFVRIGKLVFNNGVIQFGTAGTAAGSGSYRIVLPVEAYAAVAGSRVGFVSLYDSSANAAGFATCHFNGSDGTFVQMTYPAAWPTGVNTAVTEAAPWAWAASDSISFFTVYEAA